MLAEKSGSKIMKEIMEMCLELLPYFTLPANHIKETETVSQYVQPTKQRNRCLLFLIVEDDKKPRNGYVHKNG